MAQNSNLPLRFSYNFEPADLADGAVAFTKRYQRKLPIVSAAVTLGILLFIAQITHSFENVLPFLVLIFSYYLWCFAVARSSFFLRRQYTKIYKQRFASDFGREYIAEFDESGIRMYSDVAETLLQWKGVKHTVETPHSIVVFAEYVY